MVLTNSELPGFSVSIPDETEIQGPAEWNGIITAPTDVPGDGTAPAGFSVGDTVISVGSSAGTLVFDNEHPVTLLLAGVAGTVGYKPALSNTWQKITTCAGTYDEPTLPKAPGECSISNGKDTKIVTFHFTLFGELNATHGSGGGRPTTPAIPATPAVPGVSLAMPATPAQGRVLGTEVFNFTKLIKNGSKGNEVLELQKLLNTLGHGCGTADGKFGPKTKSCVVKFQIANSLKGDGIVGPLTRVALNK
jgi:hypothetical protein